MAAVAGKPTVSTKAFELLMSGARFLASLAAPPLCRHCGISLLGHENPYLCSECLTRVAWIGDGACRGCGYPAGPHSSLGDNCEHCRGINLSLTAAAATARYARGARNLVTAFKFRGETELAKPLAGLMAERFRSSGLPRPDCMLPVPLHPSRRRQRGLDQAAMLASRLSDMLGIETRTGLLRKIRHTRPQSSLDRASRLDNVRGAYKAEPGLAGMKVLLVDDVMTTGATMGECAKACRAAGATRVYALVFAR